MKKIIYFLMGMFLVSLAYSIDECKPVIEPKEVNCTISATWNYTLPCTNHVALVYNSSGANTFNFTFIQKGNSPICYFVWNVTELGSYQGLVSNGDTFNINVESTVICKTERYAYEELAAFFGGMSLFCLVMLFIFVMKIFWKEKEDAY